MLLDLLLPRRCVVCARAGAQLCAPCRAALPALTPPLCARCGAPAAWPVDRCRECAGRRLAFVSARAAVPYDDDVRRLVRLWKERGLRHLADAAAAIVADRVPCPDVEVVTFVPADRWRTRQRGHHPAAELAFQLARRWDLPCEARLRRVDSRQQRGLGARERQRGPTFDALATGGSIVVIDDVYTTGATAAAAAKALAGSVEVVTFARAVRRG